MPAGLIAMLSAAAFASFWLVPPSVVKTAFLPGTKGQDGIEMIKTDDWIPITYSIVVILILLALVTH
jgi:hypothetical protein